MWSRSFTSIVLIVALAICSGCGGMLPAQRETPTDLEKHWGKSFQSARYNQIVNPEAEKNVNPVVGLDGRTAETNVEKYRKAFQERTPDSVYTLNLGSIGSIGQK